MSQNKQEYSWVYIGFALLVGSLVLYFFFLAPGSGYVTVKYRDDKVDVSASNFEPLKESDSTVKGAWYDAGNEYMVIKLGNTYYHYCGMPSSAWDDLKSASTPYDYYENSIRGNFDCRINPVPSYG